MHKDFAYEWIIVDKDALHQPRNENSVGDTIHNTTHTIFKCELAVTLQAKDVEVGACANENYR